MTPMIRGDLDDLPSYVPGRSVPGAIKLASNEVPAAPLPSVLEAIATAAASANRYPDMAAVALRERLAQRHGVAVEQVAVGCGSVSLCQQVIQLCCLGPADEVMYAWRSFEAYPIVTKVVGATGRAVPLDEQHRHDLGTMAAAVNDRTRAVFVCNPNNPTGTTVEEAELDRFLDALPPDVVVVLDEAYHEFIVDPHVPDGLTLLPRRPNLVVLRTFSKAYRLAGQRVGYAIADVPLADALRKVGIPFGVSSPAQAAAIAALDCEAELLASCQDVIAERGRVRAALLDAGYAVPPSQGNFVWLPLGAATMAFARHCAEHKVIIRPFDGDGVRVTVGTAAENDQLLAAAQAFTA
jgi:histidinol-phosphate aminotransferase